MFILSGVVREVNAGTSVVSCYVYKREGLRFVRNVEFRPSRPLRRVFRLTIMESILCFFSQMVIRAKK